MSFIGGSRIRKEQSPTHLTPGLLLTRRLHDSHSPDRTETGPFLPQLSEAVSTDTACSPPDYDERLSAQLQADLHAIESESLMTEVEGSRCIHSAPAEEHLHEAKESAAPAEGAHGCTSYLSRMIRRSSELIMGSSIARSISIARSEPMELLCTPPVKFKLQVHKAHTALEVLQMVTLKMQLPPSLKLSWGVRQPALSKAAPLLQMQFAEAIVAHHNTMHEAGLCDQAEFSALGVDEARAQLLKEQADAVDIHLASKCGDIEAVRVVISFAPKRVHAKDRDGETPLHKAAFYHKCEAAEALLAAGADVNTKNRIGTTPLHYAVCSMIWVVHSSLEQQCRVAGILLAAGADANAKANMEPRSRPTRSGREQQPRTDGFTPLHHAASSNNCELAGVLLVGGADVNAMAAVTAHTLAAAADGRLLDGQNGFTPVQHANKETMKKLLREARAR